MTQGGGLKALPEIELPTKSEEYTYVTCHMERCVFYGMPYCLKSLRITFVQRK